MAQILDGKIVGAHVRAELADKIAKHRESHGTEPGLTVILVGDDPASAIYVASKEKACHEVGIRSHTVRLAQTVRTDDVVMAVEKANQDPTVDGILVQMPLPPQVDTTRVLAALDPTKDVDGLTTYNQGLLAGGLPGLYPCTPKGVLRLLDYYGIPVRGQRALVLGRSTLVGRPVGLLLLGRDATVTWGHSQTRDLPALVSEAEILVAAIGRPGLIQGDWIRREAVVVDVGINRQGPKKVVGDVDFLAAKSRASWITPVPGGVGLMTVAMLLENTWQAFVHHDDAR